jgi:hypothetical protein
MGVLLPGEAARAPLLKHDAGFEADEVIERLERFKCGARRAGCNLEEMSGSPKPNPWVGMGC